MFGRNGSELIKTSEAAKSYFNGTGHSRDAMPKDRANRLATQSEIRLSRNKKIKAGLWGAATIGFVVPAIVSGVSFAIGYGEGQQSLVSAEAGVLDAGTGEVKYLSVDMGPIPLSTDETEVTGLKVGLDVELLGHPFSAGTETTSYVVKRTVEFDPGDADFTYDPSKKPALTISIPDGTLSASLHILPGESHTDDTSGSVIALPAEVLTALTNTIAGMVGAEASEVPLLGEIAAGTTDVKSALRSFSEVVAVANVDTCTPLITQIPYYTDHITENAAEVARGRLLDLNDPISQEMSELLDLSGHEIAEIVNSAAIIMPENYTIGPDQDNLDKRDNYLKSKLFTTSIGNGGTKPMDCSVGKNVKLLSVDDKAGLN